MLTQRLIVARRQGWHVHRAVPSLRRSYNGTPREHKTYFQEPPPKQSKPPRRIFRNLIFGTTCFLLGGAAHSYVQNYSELEMETGPVLEVRGNMDPAAFQETMLAGVQDSAARSVAPQTPELATEQLGARAGYSISPTTVSHACQLPSNIPCEDTLTSGTLGSFNNPKMDWCQWAIFDGHAGSRTSQFLKDFAPDLVGGELWAAKCMHRDYVPNDAEIINTIKRTFTELDRGIVELAANLIDAGQAPRAEVIATAAPAISGSCALMAMFDPTRSVLRVANVGDSRAVLGRWDPQAQKYVAKPMSVDQTGFNQDEVARIQREHPGEKVVDPNTGRVHGLAVSRAFGDARWKWNNETAEKSYNEYWGARPRGADRIKTPPYLTAEPEITETRINTRRGHPDFLIMASDGLWDLMSSEDAVTCVQMWLDKHKPTNILEVQGNRQAVLKDFQQNQLRSFLTRNEVADAADEDLFPDPHYGFVKWRATPKHFIVEDDHCGMHLIRNALGGQRKGLFASIMTVQPPYSRAIRDDITVHVIFFGVDTEASLKN